MVTVGTKQVNPSIIYKQLLEVRAAKNGLAQLYLLQKNLVERHANIEQAVTAQEDAVRFALQDLAALVVDTFAHITVAELEAAAQALPEYDFQTNTLYSLHE